MQRILLLALLFCVLFACSEGNNVDSETDANILNDFSFTVDTLQIDSGEELINLSGGLRLSEVTPDKKFMYLLVPQDQGLLKINLDDAKLESRFQFEKEGPNGIGEYPSNFQYLPWDKFLITNFSQAGIFNLEGKKLKDLKMSMNDVGGFDSEDETPLNYDVRLSKDLKTHYSLPGDFFEGTRDFAVVDLETKSGKLIDLPEMDIAGDFRIINQSQNGFTIYIEEVTGNQIGDHMYITSTATSKVYRYDMRIDSLQLFEFPHKITAISKTGEVKNEVSSQEEFETEMEKLQGQIRYNPLLWDDQTQRFYRFGGKTLPKISEDVPQKSEVYLYAFDKDLNLLGETEIEELDKLPSYPFFKDGKLWSYVNIEDELGFAVMEFNFN